MSSELPSTTTDVTDMDERNVRPRMEDEAGAPQSDTPYEGRGHGGKGKGGKGHGGKGHGKGDGGKGKGGKGKGGPRMTAKLLRKACHVEAVRGDDPEWWDRLAVYTLTFANPEGVDSLGVRIGCGDTVKVCVPDYKPKSYSMSAERAGEFDLTVKVYPGGMCSGYLDSIQVGQEILVFKMGKKERHPGSHVGLVAFGVGITEALPIAKAELALPDARAVKLLWASKTYGDLFWHDEIAELLKAYPERFTIEYILSREDKEGCRKGRCTPAALRAVFDDAWGVGGGAEREGVRFLTVGTKPMMAEAAAMLNELGYDVGKHGGKHALLAEPY